MDINTELKSLMFSHKGDRFVKLQNEKKNVI